MKYICKNNVYLEEATNKTTLYEFDEFIGRKINDSYYNNYNILVSDYFENSDFLYDAITFSFNVDIDENSCINSINIHKFREKYFGHGRPITDELNLTAKDKKAIKDFFNSSIELTIDDEYSDLIRIIKEKYFHDEYKLSKVNSKGIILKDKKDNDLFISKQDIIKCLIYSHSNIDILTNDKLLDNEFIKNNISIITKENEKALSAVLSYVDFSNYLNLDKLKEESDIRKTIKESEAGYKKLNAAIKKGDDEKVKEYAKYSILYDRNQYDENIPLILATKYNPKYVDVLLKEGTFAGSEYFTKENERNKTGKNTISALSIAFDNKDYKSLEAIAKCYELLKNDSSLKQKEYSINKDIYSFFCLEAEECLNKSFDVKAAKILLPRMISFSLKNTDLSIKEIETIANIDIKVSWSEKEYKKVYPKDRDLCLRMINQGCAVSSINYFVEVDDYELYEKCASKYIGKGVNQKTYFFNKEMFLSLFEKPTKWYKIAKQHCNPHDNIMYYEKEYMDILFEKDREQFDKQVRKYSLNVNNYSPITEEANMLLKHKDIDGFIAFVEKYNLYFSNDVCHDMEEYLKKYSSKDRIRVLNYIFEHKEHADYTYASSFDTNVEHKRIKDSFIKALHDFGSDKMNEEAIDKYVTKANNVNDLLNGFKQTYCDALIVCREEVCHSLIKKTINRLAKDDFFIGTYLQTEKVHQSIDLPTTEMFRNLRNLHPFVFEWPKDEELMRSRRKIVKIDVEYYLENTDVNLLFAKGAIYYQRNTKDLINDLDDLNVSDDVIKKTVHN